MSFHSLTDLRNRLGKIKYCLWKSLMIFIHNIYLNTAHTQTIMLGLVAHNNLYYFILYNII